MTKFIIRDILLTALVLLLFLIGTENTIMQILMGLGIGLVIYLVHEWSHYLGAALTKAKFKTASALYSPFLFSFDSNANSYRQFIDMSWPGFAATLTCLAILYLYTSDMLWAEVACIAALVLGAFTLLVEGPIFLWALIRQEVPAVEIPFLSVNPVLQSLTKEITKWRH